MSFKSGLQASLEEFEEGHGRRSGEICGDLLQQALAVVHDGVVIVDAVRPDYPIVYCNLQFQKITGYTSEEVFGQNCRFLQGKETDGASVVRIRDSLARGEAVNTEILNYRKNGEPFWNRLSITPIRDSNNLVTHFVGIQQDISEHIEITERLSYEASHDYLTKLYNRREFQRRLGRLVRDVQHRNETHCVLHLDLDEFKLINDTAGHAAGDVALLEIIERFRVDLRKGDLLARLGGDEFGLILTHCDLTVAEAIGWKLVSAVRGRVFQYGGRSFPLGLSAGIAQVDHNTASMEEVLKNADVACYAAKSAGKNSVRVFKQGAQEISQHLDDMLSIQDIARAVSEDSFELYRHGIYRVSAESGRPGSLAAEEVLIRMRVGDQLIAPGRFLPAAERFNMISAIDMWVVNNLFLYLHHQSAFDRHSCFNINISGQSLGDDSFTSNLIAGMERLQNRCPNLCFEITETSAIRDIEAGIRFIKSLRRCGSRFALDDFGSGLSSLAYLKTIPVDFIKIDGTLIRDVAGDRRGRAMVKSISDMGHSLGMRVIAEYVETEECLKVLEEIGVDYAQGYYFEKPQPLLPQRATSDV